MPINWQEIITTFVTTIGGSAVLLAIAGWLIKTAITSRLTLDAEKFKAQIKVDTDAAIEQLKTRLQQAAFEHQVRFSKLHEKRASVIEELDQFLYQLEIRGMLYVSDVGQAGDEGYLKWKEKFMECNSFVQSKQLYLTEEIYSQVSQYLDAAKRPLIRVWTITSAGEHTSGASPELLRQDRTDILAAIEEINAKIPAMRSDLLREFRSILGGEK